MLAGSLAGCAATAPMTWVMARGFQSLPWHERYPLPPREITEKLARESKLDKATSNSQRQKLALLAHFGYGTAVGAIFGLLVRKPMQSAAVGSGFGLLVWAGSYLGLLPALGILKPATQHPARRNLLMIAAHLVWGGVLGIIYKWMVGKV